MEKLRFAPLIRVSTERQDKQGESLLLQRTQILDYVARLGGVIPENCWQYSGQEHATPEFEHKKFNQLIKDASRKLFDAVIICDPSRWSRDNQKSKEGLEILRANGIRFYVGTLELDLFNPVSRLNIGMITEINEFHALITLLKTMDSKIHRAKRNVPSSGLLPWGRTFNKKTETWGVDDEKKAIIEQAAARYLAGHEPMAKIAATYGMGPNDLWNLLNNKSGTQWEVRFRSPRLNIDETVMLTIPELLPQETIEAIHARADANRTWNHGAIKNQYLLSRMIFCARCGRSFTGYRRVGEKKRYYHHHHHAGNPACFPKFLDADKVERAVLLKLASTFQSPSSVEQALRDAAPDLTRTEQLRDELTMALKELDKVRNRKDRIVQMVSKGLMEEEEVVRTMTPLRESEKAIRERIREIETELETAPDPVTLRRASLLASRVLAHLRLEHPEYILKKSYDEQRAFVESMFGGRDAKRNRLGVFLNFDREATNPWTVEIRGFFDFKPRMMPPFDPEIDDRPYNQFHLTTDEEGLESISKLPSVSDK